MPQNTLTNMMELNRIVCMDYPEAGLPWFQRNFIEANINSSKWKSHSSQINARLNPPLCPVKPQQSQFYNDVQKLLLTCIGDRDLIQTDFVSPYGYRVGSPSGRVIFSTNSASFQIPFVIYLNSNNEIVRRPPKEDFGLRK